jgi:hypothetical protein
MIQRARAVFNRKAGVFWYRGMAKGQLASRTVGDYSVHFGAKRIIIGHTLQNDVSAYYGGRVLCIDLFQRRKYAAGAW